MSLCDRVAIFSLAAALLASGPAMAQGTPQKNLTVVSWGGSYTRSQMLAYVNPYRDLRGEWVSMETYNGGLDEIRELAGGDTHTPVVVYCKSGRRAGLVKEQLLEAGFDRVTNLGGLSDWPK